MNSKKRSRLKRSAKTRHKIDELGIARLSVYKSLKYIYAQVSVHDDKGRRVILQVSSLSKDFDTKLSNNLDAAVKVGQLVAKKAVSAGISQVAFDRSGYKYHGCIKALADAARGEGLKF